MEKNGVYLINMEKMFSKYLPLDKSWHFIAGVLIYTFLTLLGFITFWLFGFSITKPYKIGAVVLVGFLKEWVWDRWKGGTVSEWDAIYTTLGGICCFVNDPSEY